MAETDTLVGQKPATAAVRRRSVVGCLLFVPARTIRGDEKMLGRKWKMKERGMVGEEQILIAAAEDGGIERLLLQF